MPSKHDAAHHDNKTTIKPPLQSKSAEMGQQLLPAQESAGSVLQRTAVLPNSVKPADAQRLQRLIGNRAVGQMNSGTVRRRPEERQRTTDAASASFAAIVNRTTQLGKAPNASSPPLIQAKLTLGPVGDKYEQEADQVAKQVVGSISSSSQPNPQRQEEEEELQMKPISSIQRQEEEELQMKPISSLQRQEEEEEMMQASPTDSFAGGPISGDLESQIQGARGGGQPLAGPVRGSMEQAFGADFSGVKVHTGSQSDSLNRSVQARAFTTGSDIFFRQGEYSPGSSAGQELLAHELTHTIQQGAAPTREQGVSRDQVQRTAEDGNPAVLDPRLDLANFKNLTYRRMAQRGESLSTIDKWLAAAASADSWAKQQHALQQVADAAEHWLKKHESTEDGSEKSSISQRRPAVRAVWTEALYSLDRPVVGPTGAAAPSAKGESDGHGKEVAEGVFDSIASGAGITGDFADRGAVELSAISDYADANDGAAHPDYNPGDKMSTEGGAGLNNSKADIMEGANILTGGFALHGAIKDLQDEEKSGWEKAEAGGKAVAASEQMLHGSYKLAKGIALESGGNSTQWTQVGDIGAAYADGTAAIAETITFLKGIHDRRKLAQQGGLTTYEKVDSTLELAGSGAKIAQSGVKTGLDITKAVTEAGASEAMAGMSTAAGALGIVIGTIEFIQGGAQVFRGLMTKNQINKAEAQQQQMLDSAQAQIGQASQVTAEFLMGADLMEDSEIVDALMDKWGQLEASFKQMQAEQAKYAPAMAAVRKLESRRMESGAFKMAKGTTGVIAGALIVSGVGAPIGIAVAAIGGILALSEAGLKLSRNAAASRLTLVARRLTEEGMPKGKPDQSPDYRVMERRVYKCYYNHIPEVLEKKAPTGMSSSEFGDVKNFAWEDKRDRIESDAKTTIDSPAAAAFLNEPVKRDSWIEVQDDAGIPTHKEKPKSWAKAGLLTSASAHKSKQAMEASKDDIVNALYALGSSSYNQASQDFVDSPIVALGDADPETMASFGQVTLQALLSAADITASRWTAWLADAGDNEAKMKEHIRGKLG